MTLNSSNSSFSQSFCDLCHLLHRSGALCCKCYLCLPLVVLIFRFIATQRRVCQGEQCASKDSKILLKLHQSLVRPKLEYCVQAWRPYLQKDIDLLNKFGLTTLETRRLRGDLIEVYKLFKGYDDVDFKFFQVVKYTSERTWIENL